MSGKLICADGIYVQKTPVYVECVERNLRFAQGMPICFDGTWTSGTSIDFQVSIQKKVDVRCNLFQLNSQVSVGFQVFNKDNGQEILNSSATEVILEDVYNNGMLTGNICFENDTGSDICSFFVLLGDNSLLQIPALCVVGDSVCSDICACVSATACSDPGMA